MNKTLRNKALRQTNKLIVATDGQNDWYAPDGYFAVKQNIYDGYRMTKAQTEATGRVTGKPGIEQIIAGMNTKPGKPKKVMFMDTERMRIGTELVDTVYFDLVSDIYPDAVYEYDTIKRLAPIAVKQNGELVVLVMPVRIYHVNN